MASFVTPKKNTAFEFYVSLVDQSNTKLFKASPTLAAGDVKVSTDNGTSANSTTLPVIGTNTRLVKVNLSATEMNGDNVSVVFSDVAGAEWCDLTVNIQTSARQVDDLATPTNITAGTITTVTNLTNAPTSGDLTATMKASVTTAATSATPSVTVSDKTGFSLSTAGILAIWHQLTAAVVTAATMGKLLVDNINATISSRSTYAGGDTSGTTTLLTRNNPLDAAGTRTAVGLASANIDTQLAAVKSDTSNTLAAIDPMLDAIEAVPANVLAAAAGSPIAANVEKVNNVALAGTGTDLDPWEAA